MKDADFKDKSSHRGFGKGLMIAVVVVFSSLSFVLGYFVGKVGRDDRTGASVRAAETAVAETPAATPPAQPAKKETASDSAPSEQTLPPVPPDQAKQTQGLGSNPPAPPKEPERDVSEQSLAPVVKEQPPAKKKDPAKEEKSVERASGQKDEEIYTVQLGALRKAAEAKRLRAKIEKKGYKTFLLAAKNKKHEKIYKVRVGEFKRKKDAEVVARKLKKTEGLNAFVTVKN